MANKLNAYFDLAKLQGAYRLRLKGKDCIVINLDEARASHQANIKTTMPCDLARHTDGERHRTPV